MNPPARGISHHKQTLLLADWFICAAPTGNSGQAAPAPEGAWTAIKALKPVAAALRDLNQWSIDEPVRRFDAQDWWYRLKFDAPQSTAGEAIFLGFDGLATVAQVWLNGMAMLTSTNMFMAHAVDVSHLLMTTGNTLLIRFSALDTELSTKRKRPRWRAPMIENQQLRWFRTTVLGRTPGWSPPAAVVGPWKDIWLERRGTIDVQAVRLQATVDGTDGLVNCHLQAQAMGQVLAAGTSQVASVHLQIERQGRVESHPLTPVSPLSPPSPLSLVNDTATFEGTLQIKDVDLWWPHTHGEPALYQASLRIRVAGCAEEVTVNLGRIGFRTLALNAAGGDFSLVVNGVPIFCRGACWTPLDPVTLRSPAAHYSAAVAQARVAGMNMLRVAGTVVYEDDHFFDACDEQGVLVWHDFMFANMDYPGDDAQFMESVSTEVCQQLQRRQINACVAMLCGNSEIEQQAAMWGAPRALWSSALFDKALAQLCKAHAPHTPYWPSSAHGGSFPHQASEGTTSYYGVGAYLRPLDDARRAQLRFATECLAFANVPVQTAVARMPGGLSTRVHHPGWKARSPRDLGAGWDFDDVRDHYLASLFNTDPLKLRCADHDRYLTLSRIVTGEVMAASFSEWRRPGASCRGALVLFMRDLWAGAGWGLVDDAGTPKACYHYLKRVLQPTTVLLTDEGGNGLFVHLLNERGDAKHVSLEIAAWRDGDVQVASGKWEMVLPAHSAQSLCSLDLFEHFMDLTDAYRFGPMTCEAVVATLTDASGKQIAQAFHFPRGMSALRTTDVGLSALAKRVDAGTIELTLRTGQLARGVYFDLPGFQADDEYFNLAPNSEVRVTLRGASRDESSFSLNGTVHAVNSVRQARIEMASTAPLAAPLSHPAGSKHP